jgi:putative membrane protein
MVAVAASVLTVPSVAAAAKSDVPAPKTEVTDAQILGVVMAADSSEVDQGRIAVARGQTESVRDFAALMISDHSSGKDKTLATATALGVELEPSLMSQSLREEGNEIVAQLENMNSRDFDRTYMEAQVMLHERVLNGVEKLSAHADSRKVKSLLKEKKAHIEDHLAIAHSVLNTLE